MKIVDRGDIDFLKIDGKENPADPFTKAIRIKEFDRYKQKMGIRYCSDWLQYKWEFVGNCVPQPIIQVVDGWAHCKYICKFF